MRPADKIKRLIKNVSINTNRKTNEKVLTDLFTEFDKSKKTDSATPQPNLWRIIMKNKITKLVTAAVIIIAATIGIKHFGISIDGTSVAWAEIAQQAKLSYNDYYKELLSAMEEKDTKKVSIIADALSEFWQGINMLAKAKLDPTIKYQPDDLSNLLKEKTFYDDYEQSMQQILLEYSNEFLNWLNRIEDEAWIYEIIHISKQLEEYAEEIREPGRHPELDFSYAEHCLKGFVLYCQWFEYLPWDNPEHSMTPNVLLEAIERDLKIARREIEASKIKDSDRYGKRCMQQALRNSQFLNQKIKASKMVHQWKLCNQLMQKVSELSGLMAYLAVESGDLTQTNKIHIPEKVHQILMEKFADKESFADYFIEQIDQALNICKKLYEKF